MKIHERYKNAEFAAEAIGVSEARLRQWVSMAKRGVQAYKGIPYHQIAPRTQLRFDVEILQRWYTSKTNSGVNL